MVPGNDTADRLGEPTVSPTGEMTGVTAWCWFAGLGMANLVFILIVGPYVDAFSFPDFASEQMLARLAIGGGWVGLAGLVLWLRDSRAHRVSLVGAGAVPLALFGLAALEAQSLGVFALGVGYWCVAGLVCMTIRPTWLAVLLGVARRGPSPAQDRCGD